MINNLQNNSLVLGHLKELLSSINLPLAKVYTEDTRLYEDRVYLSGNKLCKCKNGTLYEVGEYSGKFIPNITRKFNIKSSDYDTYTHEYLGDYLRYLRDRNNLNLMGLYNCFFNNIPERLDRKVGKIEINSSDSKYNYYIVPVKFDETYTIAIDAPCSYDIMCIIYDSAAIDIEDEELIKSSHMKINHSSFKNPFLYKTSFSLNDNLWKKEKYLKLLLKLPKQINSSIAILEGDFTNCCNVIDGILVNKYVTSDKSLDSYPKLPTKLSLLDHNDHTSYPFADRLVEFILGSAITQNETIRNNISKVQNKLYPDGIRGYYDVWNPNINLEIFKRAQNKDDTLGKGHKYSNTIIRKNGKQTSNVKYDYSLTDIYSDLTYYVDKDTESMIFLGDDIDAIRN